MATSHYYLLASLPHLGDLGGATPLTTRQLLDRIIDAGGPRELVETLLLGDDLLQREATMAGELDQAEPIVLTVSQLRDEEPLPPCLVMRQEQQPARIAADAVWDAYYRLAASVARRNASRFLSAWIGCDVALRNTLARARAKALGLEAQDYMVAAELADRDTDFTQVVNEWSAASDPLAGLRVVDRARWDWLSDHEAWFTFGDDELAVYATRLMLLQRWHRLVAEEAAATTNQ